MLGLHDAGTTADATPFRVVCCEPEVGLFQAAAPVCPAMESGIPVAETPLP
jgi:hypothetical protein